MAHIDREHTAKIEKNELLEEHADELEGCYVSFMDVMQDVDLGELLKGLPGDMCQAHHWGMVQEGEIAVRYADGTTEVVHAGDAFSIRPGHAPTMAAGTKLLMFSPFEEIALTNAAIERNLAARG